MRPKPAESSTGRRRRDGELFLVGAGISFPSHLTAQTREILSRCRRVYSNLPDEALTGLPPSLRRKCVSLWPLYKEGRRRSSNYRDVADAVLKGATRALPVAWMTPGHPMFFDSVSQALLTGGRRRGWRVRVVPGISSVDTVMAELGHDPAGGLVIAEATSLVKGGGPLLPRMATLLLQPSAFGSERAHYSGRRTPNLAPLREHLLRFYPPGHGCVFIRSATEGAGEARAFRTTLGDLDSVPFEAIAGSSLFLPRCEDAAGRRRR